MISEISFVRYGQILNRSAEFRIKYFLSWLYFKQQILKHFFLFLFKKVLS